MQQTTRISIPISKEEKDALRQDAQYHLRDPRTHARFLLRQALGIADDVLTHKNYQAEMPFAEKHNRADDVLSDLSAVVT